MVQRRTEVKSFAIYLDETGVNMFFYHNILSSLRLDVASRLIYNLSYSDSFNSPEEITYVCEPKARILTMTQSESGKHFPSSLIRAIGSGCDEEMSHNGQFELKRHNISIWKMSALFLLIYKHNRRNEVV